jgi:hypothetical protein
MKFTYLDRKSLDYRCFNVLPLIISVSTIFIGSILISYNLGYENGVEVSICEMSSQEREIIIADIEDSEFSQEALIDFLEETNIKFPHIVLAQSILETGNYKSEVFAMNHNLFGMKQARIRPTTALGTSIGHAYYNNWKESVYDYALYQAAYLKNVKAEDQYLEYLGSNYAEAEHYVRALKRIIKKNKIEELFEEE